MEGCQAPYLSGWVGFHIFTANGSRERISERGNVGNGDCWRILFERNRSVTERNVAAQMTAAGGGGGGGDERSIVQGTGRAMGSITQGTPLVAASSATLSKSTCSPLAM